MLSKIHLTVSSIILIIPGISGFVLPHGNGLDRLGQRFSGTILPSRAIGQSGTLNLTYEFMTVTLGVGTPPQDQTLTFDMGSPFFWVYTGSSSDGLYDISQSSSFQNLSTDFDAGVGNAYGYWADETVNVGGIDVESAMIGTVDGTGHTQGGAMGFSPPSSTNPATGTWTSTMAQVLESPLAGLNLYETQPGPITFGYLDSSQYSGDLTWVSIDTSTGSSWTVSTIYYWIDGVSTQSSAGQPALLDTGGTVNMPLLEDIVREYYSQIPSAQDVSAAGDASSWTVDCDADMPDLQFSLSSGTNGVDDPAGEILGNRFINYGSNNGGTCQAYLYASTGQTFSRAFFMSNYVALDFTSGATRVGVAPKASNEVIPTSA